MILPLAFFGFLENKNSFFLILSFVFFIGILATFSLGSLLVLTVITGFTVYISGSTKLRTSLLVIVLVLLITIGVFVHLRGIGPSGTNKLKSPVLKRWKNWKGAASILRDYPVTGTGFGNFGVVYPEYLKNKDVQTQFVHNTYLQLTVEMGVPFGFFLFIFLFYFYKQSGGVTFQNKYRFAFFLSGLSFLLHNFVDFTFYVPAAGLTFFYILGVLYSKKGKKKNLSPFLKYALLGVFLLAGIFAVKGYTGSYYFEKAKINVEKENHKNARRQIGKSISIEGFNPEVHIFLSQLLLEEFDGNREDLNIGIKEAKKAIDLNPHTPYYRNVKGKIHLKLTQPLKAYESFRQAHRLYPVKDSYKNNVKKMERFITK